MQQLSLDVHLIQPPSFENFVAGPNAELVAQLKAIAAGARPAKCLLIWGEPASGKSHLMAAIQEESNALEAAATNSARTASSTSPIAWLDDAQDLDDLGQAHWFNTFIAQAAEPSAMIIACADRAPMHLNMRPDLRTRLGSGLVYQLKRLDDEQKAQALRQHAANRQITLPEELLSYLLRHYPRDIRSLVHILESLDRFAFEQKRGLSLPLLRDLESRSPTAQGSSFAAKTAPRLAD
jgi:DnaA-homolog protein